MVEGYHENYDNGWISVYRSIKSHWVWSDPVKLKWWLTILFDVNHSSGKLAIGYDVHQINIGQSAKSLRTWAKEFDTGTKSVVKFFDMLEKDGMIKRETIGKGKQSSTLLTVLNYGTYQKQKKQNGNVEGYAKGTQEGTQEERKGVREVHTNNNDNNYNNENNEEQKGVSAPFFENEELNDGFSKWLTMLRQRGKPMPAISIEAMQMKLNSQSVEKSIAQITQSLENSWLNLRPVDMTEKKVTAQEEEEINVSLLKHLRDVQSEIDNNEPTQHNRLRGIS